MTVIDLYTLTPQRAIELLERAVQDNGADYEVGYCQYYEETGEEVPGEPSCIVGHVLGQLQADPNVIFYEHNTENLASLVEEGLVRLREDTAKVLITAQAVQDGGHPVAPGSAVMDGDTTWGHALEVAKEEIA